jgi:dienelactone hydrolase
MEDRSAKQPCPDCTTGSLHEGTTTGQEVKLFNLDCYVSGSQTDKIIVVLTDIFGWKMNSIRLIADTLAKGTNHQVIIPDFFKGDSLPTMIDEALQPTEGTSIFTRAKNMFSAVGQAAPWFIKHREAVSRPIVEGFLKQLRAQHPNGKVAGIGYCWGGRYALLGTHEQAEGQAPLIDCAVLCHPSLTSDAEFAAAKRPISLQIGDKDQAMSMSKVEAARKIIAERSMSQTIIYPGQKHGFASRGSQKDPETVKAYNKCNQDAIAFFKANL